MGFRILAQIYPFQCDKLKTTAMLHHQIMNNDITQKQTSSQGMMLIMSINWRIVFKAHICPYNVSAFPDQFVLTVEASLRKAG